MKNIKDAPIRTAGAYVSIGGLYAFAIGWELHHGNIPVVRLGGHVEVNETGWECAAREVAEEASIRISPADPGKTCLVAAEDSRLDLKEIAWCHEMGGAAKPLLVVAYQLEDGPALSLMYLAQSDEMPTPSTEVKGIVLLDQESIQQICQGSMTLDRYLERGGQAVISADFDRSRVLEPFIQLRIFSKMLKEQRI